MLRSLAAALATLALVSLPLGAQSTPAATASAPGVTWVIDPAHSELTFRIRHIVSKVNGTFDDWSGTITADPAHLDRGAVAVAIKTASIDTRNERRDQHLRSSDFFAADSFPEITFRSRSVAVAGDTIRVAGDLTIRGVTKPVVLEGKYLGVSGAPGRRRIGFEAATTINRLDYGVKWNRGLEAGGMLLGDDVEVVLGVEAAER